MTPVTDIDRIYLPFIGQVYPSDPKATLINDLCNAEVTLRELGPNIDTLHAGREAFTPEQRKAIEDLYFLYHFA